MKKLEDLTRELLNEIGEDPTREGLIKTPQRVSKAWEFFSKGYKEDLHEIINDICFNSSMTFEELMQNLRDNRVSTV